MGGQVYPEGNNSNNNQYLAKAAGTVTAIDGLKVTIQKADGSSSVVECGGGGEEWRAHHDQPERGWLWAGGKGTGVARHESFVRLLCNWYIHLLLPARIRPEKEAVRKSAVGRRFLMKGYAVLTH